MRRAVRLVSAPLRIVQAISRHGLREVATFAFEMLRRRGVLGTLRLGVLGRSARLAVLESERVASIMAARADVVLPVPKHPEGANNLGADYGLSVVEWAAWELTFCDVPNATGRRQLGVGPLTIYVIDCPEGSSNGANVTVQCLLAAGVDQSSVWVLRSGEHFPDVALGVEGFAVFLRAGDIPSKELSIRLAQVFCDDHVHVATFDMVRRVDDRIFPMLFPGANPTMMRAVDYVFGRGAARISEFMSRDRPAFGGFYSAMMTWMEGRSSLDLRARWRHLACPLLEVNVSLLELNAARQIAKTAKRPLAKSPIEPATAIICTRDKGHLTRQLVRNLLLLPLDVLGEVVIVSNGTRNLYALETLEDLLNEPRVQVIQRDEAFNFSRLSNAGARVSVGTGPLLFLNDDITPVTEDWLQRLITRLLEADAGAVGPLLLYPDERVQHAGMYLGYNGCAGHTLRGARLPDSDYLFTGVAPREVSCLTGAALLTDRGLFEALNGFDEQLATYLQDVDYGLRIGRVGRTNIFDPSSILIHMESASIQSLDVSSDFHRQREAEHARFTQRWGDALRDDPFHPKKFDVQSEALRRLSPGV